ncbi:cell division protein FtsI (penicillin-binding protein 3) [Spirosomataceae bacterium TFI 002]|nr:cell division protein FtsI (penicillin-binding protein 3) [Spirosomataceae bacterium TFI 002]
MRQKKVGIKGQIKGRSKWVMGFLICLGLVILGRIFKLQTGEQSFVESGEKTLIKERSVPAMRGNIYANDGKSLLATSVPIYKAGLDPLQANDELFKESVDSLSYLLSKFFKDRSKASYKDLMVQARNTKKRRYVGIGDRKISHEEKEIIETFPLFREGKHKGGGKFDREENRFMPFNSMAMRSVGKLDAKTKRKGLFGIEYSFNNYLAGKDGKGEFERLPGGYWLPVESGNEQQAVPGNDVVTTIDVNFQDIVESTLRNQVIATNANYGTAIVMEIATGEVRAIANLTRRQRGDNIHYLEDENHAVLGRTDPGSTFKLATMLALLEEGSLKPTDFAVDCRGILRHNSNANFTCSHEHGNLTVQQVFEQSCNIGVYELVRRVFGFKSYDKYLEYLEDFKLNQPVGFQLKGEKKPYIKTSKDKTYSNTTFPWMSIGYEMSISPLQMLTFYNAVANDGYWIQPIIVKEIRDTDETITTFSANKMSSRFCSKQSINFAQAMLSGVTERGTAKGISKGYCTVAGKTGTAQKRKNGVYQKGKYYTSFIGYFPADNPKYSCLVVIDQPRGDLQYAGDVCAPVFRKIADRIFAYDVEIHPSKKLSSKTKMLANQQKAGHTNDLMEIAEKFQIETEEQPKGEFSRLASKNNKPFWQELNEKTKLPNVNGLVLRDALPLLENKGYRVKHSGYGKVVSMEEENGFVVLVLN